MLLTTLFHEKADSNSSACACQLESIDRSRCIMRSHAVTKASGVEATATPSRSPYWRITSAIGVLTTGRPAARYSGVLVGLMNFVAALIANGIRATSHPAA